MSTPGGIPAGRTRIIPAVVLAALTSACGNGSTDPDADPVDASDARRLVEYLAASRITWPDPEDRPTCPLGGDVGVIRSYGVGVGPDGSDYLAFFSAATFEGCRSATASGVWTLDGLVGAEVRYHLDPLGRVVRIDGIAHGTLEWSRHGDITACTLDLTLDPDGASDTLHITGTACGFAVDTRVPASG